VALNFDVLRPVGEVVSVGFLERFGSTVEPYLLVAREAVDLGTADDLALWKTFEMGFPFRCRSAVLSPLLGFTRSRTRCGRWARARARAEVGAGGHVRWWRALIEWLMV
jgi:hypothetical protein